MSFVIKFGCKTSEMSIMHCWGQTSCRDQLKSTRGQIAMESLMTSKLDSKNPDQSVTIDRIKMPFRGFKGPERWQLLTMPKTTKGG